MALAVIPAWLAGDVIRARRGYQHRLEAQSVREAAEHDLRVRAEERLRLSREVHDVLSHSLSMIAVRSGVARLVLDEQPEEARVALTAIETASRSALDDLRQLLRQILEPAAEREPATPTLADLPGLVERVRHSGLDVSYLSAGEPAAYGTTAELAAYRIVQEALTNVVKHARDFRLGPGGARPARSDRHCERRRRRAVPVARSAGPGNRGHAGARSDARRRALGRNRARRRLRGGGADLRVVGEASNGVQAVQQAKALRPDVVLMDIRMPVMDGLEATKIMLDGDGPAPRVLVVTTFDEDEHVFEALRSGASGFVLKDTQPEHLLDAIRTVAAGEALLAPSIYQAPDRRVRQDAPHPPARRRAARRAHAARA